VPKPKLEGEYYWIKVSRKRWAKVLRLMKRMEQSGEDYGFKMTVNRVASMKFAEMVDSWK
jgi:hypothetical protein